jgi:hypothetical protein
MSGPNTPTCKTLNWPAHNRAPKHGGLKRRVWRKAHLGIGEQTLEIRAVDVPCSDVWDVPMLADLLDQIPVDQERPSPQPLPRATMCCGHQGTPVVRCGDDAKGYHRRIRAETKMLGVKLLGQRLMARDFGRQVVEIRTRVAVLTDFRAPSIRATKVPG